MARQIITPKGKQVNIEGLAELNDKLSELMDRSTAQEVKKIWMQAGLELRDAAREYAPIAEHEITYYKAGQAARTIQPGALRAAIFAAYGEDEKQNILVGANYNIAPHCHWIEYGNTRIAAQPYMRPAITLMRDRMVSIIADGYRKLLIENGSIPEPDALDGPIPPPAVTEKAIQKVRARAQAKFNQSK
jgi:hypothetical protein